jgi:hypothetical protein
VFTYVKNRLEDLGADGKIILRIILKKWAGRVWTGFIWLGIEIIGEFL